MTTIPEHSGPANRANRACTRRAPGTLVPYGGRAARRRGVILRLERWRPVELLMIKRAAYPGDPWSGHIALPGGRQEPTDATLEQTAIRETFEETALDLGAMGRLIGTLDEVHPRTPRLPPLIIRPYVFIAPRNVTIAPSAEVAEAFWVPLPLLAHPSATGEATFTDRGIERTERSFRLGQHVVWG